jgi:hypothetical protein
MIEVRIGREVEVCRDNTYVPFFERMEVGVGALVEIGEFACEPKVISAVLVLAFLKTIGPISVCLLANPNTFDG